MSLSPIPDSQGLSGTLKVGFGGKDQGLGLCLYRSLAGSKGGGWEWGERRLMGMRKVGGLGEERGRGEGVRLLWGLVGGQE